MNLFADALRWLERSHGFCQKIRIKDTYTDEEYDHFETLTSRYARVTDMLISKVFRSLDRVEFLQSGTLIDVVNRAHKRNLIDSVDQLRSLKDLRNDIAHEYAHGNLPELFKEVFAVIPILQDIATKTTDYARQYLTSPQ